MHPLQCSHCWSNCCQQHSLHNHHPNLTLWLSSSPWYHKPFVFHRSIRTEHHPNSIWCGIHSITWSVTSTVPAKQWPVSTELLLHISVFLNIFLASALFSDKQISIAPLPCLAVTLHVSKVGQSKEKGKTKQATFVSDFHAHGSKCSLWPIRLARN